LGELLRKNCNAFSYETIQEIAEALLAIKHKLQLKAYKKATLTAQEVAKMTSAEMKERMGTDPDFVTQVNGLGNFKELSWVRLYRSESSVQHRSPIPLATSAVGKQNSITLPLCCGGTHFTALKNLIGM